MTKTVSEKSSKEYDPTAGESSGNTDSKEYEMIDNRYCIVETYKSTPKNSIYKIEDSKDGDKTYSMREFVFLDPDKKNLENFSKFFKSKLEKFSKISDLGIVSIVNYFSIENKFYIIYDFKEGITLTDFLQHFHTSLEQAMPEGLLLLILSKLIQILEYLHSLNEPYYSIEILPSSILTNSSLDSFSLIGFGLPYIYDELNKYCDEEYESIPDTFKTASHDIWCLAAIIYFLISGLDLQRFDSLIHSDIKAIRPDLSDRFCSMLSKALGTDRCSQYSNIDELKVALLAVGKPRPIESYDFYYKFLEIPISSNWDMYMGNAGRTAALGAAPKIPMAMLWSYTISDSNSSSIIPFEDAALVAPSDGRLYMIDSKGELIWDCALGEYINPPIVSNGNIYISSSSSPSIFCICPASENPGVWRTSVDGILIASPVISKDRLYQISDSGMLFAFSPETGELDWKYDYGIVTSSQILCLEDQIFAVSNDGHVYCYNIAEKALSWKYNTGSNTLNCCSGNAQDIFIVNNLGEVYSIARSGGTLNWKVDMADFTSSPVRVISDMCICITQKGIMYNIAADGSINWKLNLGSAGEYSYSITNNRAYIFAPDGRILVVDIFTGRLVDKATLREKLQSKPLIHNNTLYFVTASGILYAFG